MATQSTVKNILLNTFKSAIEKGETKIPPFLLIGEAGIGKSQIVMQVAKELGITLRDRRLSQFPDSGDLVGIPVRSNSSGFETTVYARPFWLPSENEDYNILFLDEFNRAILEVRQAAFQLLTEWRINTHIVSPKTFLVMAINKDNEDNFVNTLDRATNSRMIHLPMSCSTEDWLKWAKDNIHPSVYKFIELNPELLYPTPSEDISKPYACPRTYEFVSKLLNLGLDVSSDFVSLLAGCLGEEIGLTFYSFLGSQTINYSGYQILDEYPLFKEDIENNYSNAKYEATNRSIKEVLTEFAEAEVSLTLEQNRNLVQYLCANPKELAYLCLKDILSDSTEGSCSYTLLEELIKYDETCGLWIRLLDNLKINRK